MANKHNYKKHANDFLNNEKFIEWRLFRTQEMDDYWQNYLLTEPENHEAIETAINKFNALRINDYKLSDSQKEILLKEILHQSLIKRKFQLKKLYYWSAAVACVLILGIVLPKFTQNKEQSLQPEVIVGNILPSENIKLISGSKSMALKQNSQIKIHDDGTLQLNQANEQEDNTIVLEEEENNTLIVPYGKRASLTLSDGTQIWLNSGTRLDFPTKFNKKTRDIKVEGEIFLDVAHNANQPFYVHSQQLTIKVYGTKFNVSTYNDNEEKSVVLVEGKVEVQASNYSRIMNPGELFGIQNGKLRYEKVNLDEYTSWIDGLFCFKHANLGQILRKVGKYYNIDFNHDQLATLHRTYTGQLYLSNDIDQVLNVICTLSDISYKKSGSKIVITPNETQKTEK
ncbi:MAG: FecR protein [Bacteroidetes bacterium]|nr:FecR protein [Bacteroidota bacterium]